MSDEAILPRQLTITPTGLKAANAYLMELTERGLSYRKVKTKIEFYKDNPRDTYVKARFKMAGKLPENRAKDVDYLRSTWLPIMNNQVVEQDETPAESAPRSATAIRRSPRTTPWRPLLGHLDRRRQPLACPEVMGPAPARLRRRTRRDRREG